MAEQPKPGVDVTCKRCHNVTHYSDEEIKAKLAEQRPIYKSLTPSDTMDVEVTCPFCSQVNVITLRRKTPPPQ